MCMCFFHISNGIVSYFVDCHLIWRQSRPLVFEVLRYVFSESGLFLNPGGPVGTHPRTGGPGGPKNRGLFYQRERELKIIVRTSPVSKEAGGATPPPPRGVRPETLTHPHQRGVTNFQRKPDRNAAQDGDMTKIRFATRSQLIAVFFTQQLIALYTWQLRKPERWGNFNGTLSSSIPASRECARRWQTFPESMSVNHSEG